MIKPGAVSPPVPSPLLNVSELLRCCEGSGQQPPADMHSLLQAISLFTPLLNTLGDMVFFIKDRHARYLIANQTLARRCGFKSVAPLLGKTCAEVFPQRLGHLFTEQDHQVLHTGRHLQDRLELHLYSGRKTGWCLTQKLPLRNQQREVIGIAGISQDLQEIRRGQRAYPGLCALEYYLRQHFHRPIAMKELTRLTGLSVAQIERYCKRVFHLTPRQMIHRIRMEHATTLLENRLPITDIALQCGYTDHSAFSRQFKAMTGSTPRDYRDGLVS